MVSWIKFIPSLILCSVANIRGVADMACNGAKIAYHSFHHFQGLAVERVQNKDPFILKAREAWLIKKFDCFRNGQNKEPWKFSLASVGFFFHSLNQMNMSELHIGCQTILYMIQFYQFQSWTKQWILTEYQIICFLKILRIPNYSVFEYERISNSTIRFQLFEYQILKIE